MAIDLLMRGYQRFYKKYFNGEDGTYQELSTMGQNPHFMVVSCSDSRVDPSILFDIKPGDLFVVRNVANLVPPYQPATKSLHGVSAALEFGVRHLNVRHIIVLGHSQCGGIQALYEGVKPKTDFIEEWVESAAVAREKVKKQYSHLSQVEQLHCCERETIKLSLRRLQEFPWIKERMEKQELDLHGWYFQIHDGALKQFEEDTGEFSQVKL